VARLVVLVEDRQVAQRAVDAEVAWLRGVGADWATIGRALGVTRQAARQRYG
jgi:hypothetical protein